jgi:hypothetical protein
MNLALPKQTQALGPQWATDLTVAMTSIDSHDHTSARGQRLVSASININAAVDLQQFSLLSLKGLGHRSISGSVGLDNTVYVRSGDLYYIDNSSNNIRLTNGSSLDVSGFGSIRGDYSSTTSVIYYTDTQLRYTLENSLGVPSNVLVGPATANSISATQGVLGSMEANNDVSLQALIIN